MTSSYATFACYFLNGSLTKLMRGAYVELCIYQFPPFIPEKNKHVVSDRTYNCPHSKRQLVPIDHRFWFRGKETFPSTTSTPIRR